MLGAKPRAFFRVKLKKPHNGAFLIGKNQLKLKVTQQERLF